MGLSGMTTGFVLYEDLNGIRMLREESGSDRENARKECLEASARGLSEDLVNFLKAQGG